MAKGNYNSNIELLIQRTYAALAKRLLMLLEDLHFEHNNAFDKICDNYKSPELCDLLDKMDYFDDAKFAHCRKRILDIIGDARRETYEEIDRYDINIK